MCTFHFRYVDKSIITVTGVKEVQYLEKGPVVQVKENELLTHRYPVNVDMTLYSSESTHCISAAGLRFIEIKKN